MSKGMNKNTSIGTVKMIQGIGSQIDWKNRKNTQIVKAFLTLKNEEEVKSFMRDLMTPSEIQEFANRLEAATLLSKEIQYNAINESTGLSSATIARIAKWLKGSLGGYRLVLARLSKNSNHHTLTKLGKGLSLSA